MRHLGQMNSVMPGATASTPRQPAQRTCTGADAAGDAPRPAIAEGPRVSSAVGPLEGTGDGGVSGSPPRGNGLGFWVFTGVLACFSLGSEGFLPFLFFSSNGY